VANVTVLGLGNMGSALVRTFVAAGHDVTVWNRTPGRADALRDIGAGVARSLADAVAASPLVVVCMMGYDNLYEQLGQPEASGLLEGVTLVNFMLGTSAEAREAQRWAAVRGARYLDGTIPVFPSDVGLPDTSIMHAGDASAWEEHGPTLMALGGRSGFQSGDVGVPNVLENSLSVWFYHVAHLALLEAAGTAHALGAESQAVEERTDEVLDVLERAVHSVFDDLRSGRWVDTQATVDVHRAALETARADALAAGCSAITLDAGIGLLDAAGAAGIGDGNLAALARWVRTPDGAAEP